MVTPNEVSQPYQWRWWHELEKTSLTNNIVWNRGKWGKEKRLLNSMQILKAWRSMHCATLNCQPATSHMSKLVIYVNILFDITCGTHRRGSRICFHFYHQRCWWFLFRIRYSMSQFIEKYRLCCYEYLSSLDRWCCRHTHTMTLNSLVYGN